MNILVLGNGFDLAHGLPTKYADFLEYIEMQEATENKYMMHETELHLKCLEKNNLELIGKVFNNSFRSKDILAQELEFHRLDNIWIEYFIANSTKENWIDFEREIYKIIGELNENMGDDINKSLDCVTNNFIRYKIINYVPPYIGVDRSKNLEGNLGILRDRLVFDLNRLIRALEIYLCICVEKIPINIISSDIEKLNPDKVLSFNYTNTYEKLYGIDKEIEYDYIHGKTDINNTVDTNNMVLGIDEYLKKKRINKDIEFIEFKKYYQRIHKETGCKYRNWVGKIKEESDDTQKSIEYFQEIKYMQINDYNSKHNTLRVSVEENSENGKSILLELPTTLSDEIWEYIHLFRNDINEESSQYLFLNRERKVITPSFLSAMFKSIKDENKIEKERKSFTSTGLAKYAIKNMIKNGIGSADIKLVTGMEDVVIDACEMEVRVENTKDIGKLNRIINSKIRGIETYDYLGIV